MIGAKGVGCATMATHSYNGCTQLQWLHTATMAAHSYNGCTQLQWLHTATMAAHSYNGCTQLQWLHTATMAAHSYNGCTQLQWLHTATMAAHSYNGCTYNGCTRIQWLHTDTNTHTMMPCVVSIIIKRLKVPRIIGAGVLRYVGRRDTPDIVPVHISKEGLLFELLQSLLAKPYTCITDQPED